MRIINNRVNTNSGTGIRIGRGYTGDNNHQANEYMSDGSVRSVAIWHRVLTEQEMKAIAESLNDDGGLLF